jgi:chemotaxis protein histidine kinase CheA
MQAKKRAKPVKFGKKANADPVVKAEDQAKKIEEEAEDIKRRVRELESQQAEEKASENEPKAQESDSKSEPEVEELIGDLPEHKSVEAHYSSIETLDIKETPQEEGEVESLEAEPVNEENTKEENEDKDDILPEDVTKDDIKSEETAETEDQEQVEDEPAAPIINRDGAFFNTPPDSFDRQKSAFPYFLKVALIAFLLGLTFFAGIYYAVKNQTFKSIIPFGQVSEPTKTPPSPTPTEVPVDLSKYTIRVLNGTGRSGEAATVRDDLNTAGFNVVSIGNAAGDDIEQTQITAIEKVEVEFLDRLKKTLGETYVVGETARVATAAAEIVVTIGSETAE